MCVDALLAYMSLYYMGAWCLWRTEEDIGHYVLYPKAKPSKSFHSSITLFMTITLIIC